MTGLTAAARMERIKLRSLWPTAWIFAIFAASMVGLAILDLGYQTPAHMSLAGLATYDVTKQGFEGLLISVPMLGVLGALAITGEYSSGLIRTPRWSRRVWPALS